MWIYIIAYIDIQWFPESHLQYVYYVCEHVYLYFCLYIYIYIYSVSSPWLPRSSIFVWQDHDWTTVENHGRNLLVVVIKWPGRRNIEKSWSCCRRVQSLSGHIDGRNPADILQHLSYMKSYETWGYSQYQLVIAGFLNHQQYGLGSLGFSMTGLGSWWHGVDIISDRPTESGIQGFQAPKRRNLKHEWRIILLDFGQVLFSCCFVKSAMWIL